MTELTEFYRSRITSKTADLNQLKRRLAFSSTVRTLVFLAACVAVYYTFSNYRIAIAIVLLAIFVFVLLVTNHNKLKYQRDLTKSIIDQNEVELEVLNRAFHHLPSGDKYQNPLHSYSQDIDLFGRGSFFQYLNRTALESGSSFLAALLTQNDIDGIPEKQEAVKELEQKPDWRQRFSGIASQVKTEVNAHQVANWLRDYVPFMPRWIKPVSMAFSVISVVLGILFYLDIISGYFMLGWFFLGVTIVGNYYKRVSALLDQTTKVQSTIEQFHRLLLEIENQEFSSVLLTKKRNEVVRSKVKASGGLKKFSRYLDNLEQRNVMIFGQIVSGLFLMDLKQSYNIEQWIIAHRSEVPKWFETIAFFDAYNSLGNFAFNNPTYVFPEITDANAVLDIKGAGHPLLKPETMVRNDFHIASEEFFIVTGANMAGKSTFLRTVSLQIVMGNIGLPVCAEKSRYNPIKLITSMRTTDSLTDDESYFFSELKRLKFIVDEIKTDRYFIILDEILKGTNSTDKAIGSRKFVEKLVGSNSTGIIATHDLSLCAAAEDLTEVKNYFFDAQIIDGELYFDYSFKPGICKNMNASFLLKKMEIVD